MAKKQKYNLDVFDEAPEKSKINLDVFDEQPVIDMSEPQQQNPIREIKEKEVEAKAYEAGLVPDLKPFTPETYVAEQSTIQPFLENNVLNHNAYFAQKEMDDEIERQEKIKVNSEKLGLDPEFLNRVIDINRSVHPIYQEKEQYEDYLLGSVASFNEGLADVFRTLDRASTMMADAVGLEWKNPIWDTMAESLTKVGAEGDYKVPDNIVGSVAGGIAGMAPDLMMTYFMPEMKLTQMSKLTGGALTKIPKFPTWLGAKQGLQAYAQSGDSADRYRDFFSGAQHGFTEGLTYEALGLLGSEAGNIAKALGASVLMTETTSGLASGTLFGTHGALMNPEFLETGQIDPKQFFTDFGIGLAFHGKKIGDEAVNLAMVNQSMLRKAHASFWTSNRDLVRTGFVSPKSQYELRRESQRLWDSAMKAENPTEKNQLLLAKNAVDNIVSSRAYAIMIGSNPKRFKDAIKNDSKLSDQEKETMTRRIEETAEDFKTTLEEGARGTVISPDFDKFYEKPTEKLTETAKKKAEKEKKLTETEEQVTEREQTKKLEEPESSQKVSSSDEASVKKREELKKEKEVKDAEKTTQETGESVQKEGAEGGKTGQGSIRNDGKNREAEKEVTLKTDKDGKRDDERRVSTGGKEMQKQQVQKQAEEAKTAETKGKTEQGREEKAETGEKKEKENVEVFDGKIKSKKDFLSDVEDAVSKKAIDGKSNRIVKDKQKSMDKEWKSAEKKKKKELDKGVDVTIFDELKRTTKQYRVKRKTDGTLVISSYAEKDALGRPKPLSRVEKDSGKLNQTRKKITEEYDKLRESELKKERNALEERYIKETDAEIKSMRDEYLTQRKKEAPKKAEEFQKEDTGEFPEKPTVKEGGKKQRAKMPSAKKAEETKKRIGTLESDIDRIKNRLKRNEVSDTEKKKLSELLKSKEKELRRLKKPQVDEMAAIKDEIKMWTKAAREQKEWTESEFKKVSGDIRKKLKESVDSKHISAAKYKTIITRLEESVGGSEKKQKAAIDYVDKVLADVKGTTERIDLMERIKNILDKKRTTTKVGARKAKTNKPLMEKGEVVVDKSGNPVLSETGVDPKTKTYLEEAKRYFDKVEKVNKRVVRLKKAQEAFDKKKNPTKEDIDRINKLQNKVTTEFESINDAVREAEIAIATSKSDVAIERAKMTLRVMDDMVGAHDLTNDKLVDILDVLQKRQSEGAGALNKAVEKSVENYNNISGIVEKGTAEYGIDTPEFQKSINRRRLFNLDRQMEEMQGGLGKKLKWWFKDKILKFKERKGDVLIEDLMSPNAHLESTTMFVDRSKDNELSRYITEKIASGTSQELKGVNTNKNKAYGSLAELIDSKIIKELEKEFGKKDDIWAWVTENNKMTPKMQAKIWDAVNKQLAEWNQASTGLIKLKIKGKETHTTFTTLQVMKLYAWSKNEKLSAELEGYGISKESIESMIPDKAKKWVDYIVDEFMPETHNQINAVHEKVNRVSLTKTDNYFPAEREKPYSELGTGKPYMSQNVSDNMYGFLIDRVKDPKNTLRVVSTDKKPTSDFVDLLNRYVENAEHYKSWAEKSKEMDAVLEHPDFKAAAESVGLYNLIRHQVDININGASHVRNDYANTFVGRVMSKYATVQLAAKINMIPKQFTSFINGIAEAENPYKWTSETMKLMMNPMEARRTFIELYQQSPKFKERVDNAIMADPDLRGGVGGFGKTPSSKVKKAFNKILNGYIPIGDQFGILYGYGAIYKEVLRETGSKEKAVQAFEKYEGTQQTRSPLYLSSVQLKKNAMSRLLMLFKSMPQLLLNKSAQAANEMYRGYKREGIRGIKKKDMRKFVVNHFVTNVLFQAVANVPQLIYGNDDEYFRKINRAAVVGSLNGFFILGDVIDWGVGKFYAHETYDLQLTRAFEDLWLKPGNEIFRGKQAKDMKQIAYGAGLFASYMNGLPLKTIQNVYEGIADLGDGDVTTGFLRMLGYTDYTIESAKEMKDKKEDNIGLTPYEKRMKEKYNEAEKQWKWGKDEKSNPNGRRMPAR